MDDYRHEAAISRSHHIGAIAAAVALARPATAPYGHAMPTSGTLERVTSICVLAATGLPYTRFFDSPDALYKQNFVSAFTNAFGHVDMAVAGATFRMFSTLAHHFSIGSTDDAFGFI
eukprot:6200211-Pleurochrysis_carterae.AAC.8